MSQLSFSQPPNPVEPENYSVEGTVPLTRHIQTFDLLVPQSTESDLRNPDKRQLRAAILAMLQQGLSYRQIGVALGIHWTRVGQIIKTRRETTE